MMRKYPLIGFIAQIYQLIGFQKTCAKIDLLVFRRLVNVIISLLPQVLKINRALMVQGVVVYICDKRGHGGFINVIG